MRCGESFTDPFPVWHKYDGYIRACAEWHRRQLAEWSPKIVVLMGRAQLWHFGKLLFPELATHWEGHSTIKSVYTAGREFYQVPNGPHVLLMPHPSFWHAYPSTAKTPAITRLRNLLT